MAPDIFRVLVQSELSSLPVTCTQMITVMDFVSRPCNLSPIIYAHFAQRLTILSHFAKIAHFVF